MKCWKLAFIQSSTAPRWFRFTGTELLKSTLLAKRQAILNVFVKNERKMAFSDKIVKVRMCVEMLWDFVEFLSEYF